MSSGDQQQPSHDTPLDQSSLDDALREVPSWREARGGAPQAPARRPHDPEGTDGGQRGGPVPVAPGHPTGAAPFPAPSSPEDGRTKDLAGSRPRGGAPAQQPGEDAPSAHLVVVGGPSASQLFRLTEQELVLGRGTDVNGRLADVGISQRHAKVIFHSGNHVLIDLGSTNGTWLNDVPVEGPAVLQHRDTIRIGQTVIKYLTRPLGSAEREETMRLDPVAGPRPDLVLHRDARLRTLGTAALDGYGDVAATPAGPDWIFYARKSLDYAKRYGLFVALMAAVGAGAGAVHAVARPPLASAYFEITLSREAKANPLEEEQSVAFFVAAERSFTSVALVRATLKQLRMNDSEAAARVVQQSLTFAPEDRLEQVWRGEVIAADAESARKLLSTHLQTYLDRELDRNVRVLRAEIALLEDQLGESGESLRTTETDLADFKREHPGVVGAEGVEHYASLSGLQARRDELSARVSSLQMELNLNRERLRSGDALLRGRVSGAESYSDSLREAQGALAQARAEGLGDEHPTVKRLTAKIDELQRVRGAAISAQPTDLDRRTNDAHVAVQERVKDLEVALKVAQTELGQTSSRLGDAEQNLSTLPEAEARLAKLTRNYSSTRTLHDKLYQKLQASKIQLNMEQESAKARYDLITPPTAVPPNLVLTALMRGGIGGFVLFFMALVVAIFREGIRYLRTVL